MVNFFPRLEDSSTSTVTGEYIFVIDRSGTVAAVQLLGNIQIRYCNNCTATREYIFVIDRSGTVANVQLLGNIYLL